MKPVIKKMLEAYYEGEDVSDFGILSEDMERVHLAILDDMRDWAKNDFEAPWPTSPSEVIESYCKSRNGSHQL